MSEGSKHAKAWAKARQVCQIESVGQIVTKAVVAAIAVFVLWYTAGPNEAYSEIALKAGAVLAIIFILPTVYVWSFFDLTSRFKRNSVVSLLLIGSLLAIVGVGIAAAALLQVRQSSPNNQQVKDLQDQLTAIQGQLSTLADKPAPTPPLPAPARSAEDPASTLRRSYIGNSKIVFDENLTKLSRLLNGRGLEAVKIADRFLPSFDFINIVGFQPEKYEAFKANPSRAIETISEVQAALDKLLREEREQAEDLKDILANEQPMLTFKSRMEQTVRYYDSFRIIYEGAASSGSQNWQNVQSNAALLFGTLKESTLKDVAAFNEWIDSCNRRIAMKRKALGP
jgi:hypothetical protein